MARTSKRNTEIEEFGEDSLRFQEIDSAAALEERYVHLEDNDSDTLELGDTGRRGFSRLNDEELFRYRD